MRSVEQKRLFDVILCSYSVQSTFEDENRDGEEFYVCVLALFLSETEISGHGKKLFQLNNYPHVSSVKPFTSNVKEVTSDVQVETERTKQGTELDVHSSSRKKLDSEVFIADLEDYYFVTINKH